MTLTTDEIVRLPKVVLHDHLDGGLRPATVAEIAAEVDHALPTTEASSLGDWFYEAADSGSLVRYLETFEHTIACMQTPEHLRRVAREWVLDLAGDGVVYGEARWAPGQHTRLGLSERDAVAAVGEGLRDGMVQARDEGTPMVARQLVTALRHLPSGTDLADLAVNGERGLVAGFDLAGPEDGFPATNHAEVFDYLRRNWVPCTIHAGEAAGVASIEGALRCGALRLGHGARLVEDLEWTPVGWHLGPVATWVRDRRIPLELSPSSNLQTGVAPTIASHPFGTLAELGFAVTVNCDNRLMSRTTMTRELSLLVEAFGYGIDDLRRFTLDAARGAFLPWPERRSLIADVIEPGYRR